MPSIVLLHTDILYHDTTLAGRMDAALSATPATAPRNALIALRYTTEWHHGDLDSLTANSWMEIGRRRPRAHTARWDDYRDLDALPALQATCADLMVRFMLHYTALETVGNYLSEQGFGNSNHPQDITGYALHSGNLFLAEDRKNAHHTCVQHALFVCPHPQSQHALLAQKAAMAQAEFFLKSSHT